jgi:hypothetical protein
MKQKRRRGRPTRQEASKAALAGIDLAAIDPRQVLLTICADPSAPASARVAAARALLGNSAAADEQVVQDGDIGAVARALLAQARRR